MADILQYEVEKLKITDTNPRGTPNGAALRELCNSIERVGILNPLLVTPKGEILSGKRRYTAATTLKLKTVPVIVMDVTPEQAEEIALIDNLQRQDLSPMEEAEAYDRLLEKYGVAEVAAKVGKAKSYVQRRHALTQLIPSAQKALAKGELSVGNAELLARLDDDLQKELMMTGALTESTTEFKNTVSNSLAILANVGFDKKDAMLYQQAGSCVTCQKRTGSDTTLFADITKEEDRCTDTVCFWKKVELHEKRAVKEGAVKITDQWGTPEKGTLSREEWHRTTPQCKDTKKGVFDQNSRRPGEIITICTGKACLKGKTVDTSTGGVIKKAEKSEKEKQAEFEQKVDRAYRRALLRELTEIFSTQKQVGPYHPIVMEWLRQQIRSDEVRLLAKVLELTPSGNEFDKWEKPFDKWLKGTMENTPAMLLLVIALNNTRYASSDPRNDYLLRLSKTAGIDVAGMRKEVRDEMLAPKTKEEKK